MEQKQTPQLVRLNAQLNLVEGLVQMLFEHFAIASASENWEMVFTALSGRARARLRRGVTVLSGPKGGPEPLEVQKEMLRQLEVFLADAKRNLDIETRAIDRSR